MPCQQSIEQRDGIAVHVLRTAEAEVRIVPELGAKISSLRDRRTGREWLWSPPDAQLFRNRLGDSFDKSTIIGADECFPTIAACNWRNRNLPDHGEAWSLPWTVEAAGNSVTTKLTCVVSPFVMDRPARLEANILHLDYTLTNVGAQPEEFLWALHPLMTIHPGDRLEIPTTQVTLEGATNCPLGERGTVLSWPRPNAAVHLAKMDFGQSAPWSLKAFAFDLTGQRAAIVNDVTGERLTILYSGEALNTLGIFINRGGWNGFHKVALEPSTGAPDALDVAAKDWRRCGKIMAGQRQEWSVRMELQAPAKIHI
jgi:galactose mutarotase-like enzyme